MWEMPQLYVAPFFSLFLNWEEESFKSLKIQNVKSKTQSQAKNIDRDKD